MNDSDQGDEVAALPLGCPSASSKLLQPRIYPVKADNPAPRR